MSKYFSIHSSKNVMSPMEKDDHPELDTSEVLDLDGIQKYQSLIEAIQWVSSISRFDIQTVVMTLSSFCVTPHCGHSGQNEKYTWLSC